MPDNINTPSRLPKDTIVPANEKERQMFEAFVQELTDGDNIPPQAASRDARYYLTLEKEKMQSMGISVKESIKKTAGLETVTGRVYHGDKYTGHLLFRSFERKAAYYKNGRCAYTHKEKLVLYQLLVNANRSPDPKETFCCPSCGGINTLEELESGCNYCGSRFMMSELYPKITEYFWLHDLSVGKKEMGVKLLLSCIVGSVIGAAAGGFAAPLFPQELGISGISLAISLGVIGCFFGPVIYILSIFGNVLLSAVKAIPVLSRTAGDKARLEQALRPADPYFFYGIFESRVLSLLKIMLYSSDLSDSAVYCGNGTVPPNDVIEVRYKSAIDIEKTEQQGDYNHITLTVFTDCVHFRHGRFFCKSEEYRMEIIRHKNALTDQGFFIKKVECPCCGGSFDASKNRKCPFCGKQYRLADHDWAVLSVKKV